MRKITCLNGLSFALLLLYLCTFRSNANQQVQQMEYCATMLVDKNLRDKYPDWGKLSDFNKDLMKKIETRKNAKSAPILYTIPIVFHIIHDNEAVGTGDNIPYAQVQSQLDVLNDDYRRAIGTPGHNTHPDGADVEIEFCLATTDQNGNPMPEPGVNRIDRNTVGFTAPPYAMVALFGTSYVDGTVKPATIWSPTDYYNVWVLSGSSPLGVVAGYAQFPETPGIAGLPIPGLNTPANTDGVVVDNNFFGSNDAFYGAPAGGFATLNAGTALIAGREYGRTLSHETGHWLGLFHVWGNCIPFFTAVCCGTGQTANGEDLDDYCNDTPDSAAQNAGCPGGTDTCPGGGVDMIENYMDYSDGNCQNILTQDQKTRMQTVMVNSPRRMELASSTVCGACVPQTFYADTDSDGYGDPNNTVTQCAPAPAGYVLDNTDCNDTDNNNFPTNPEVCDGADNNCNGQIDEGAVCAPILELKAFLQGTYAGTGSMNTGVNSLLPLTSPYTVAPWNAVAEVAPSIPVDAVDWVLVEALDASNTVLETRAAFVRNDGMILELDGTVGLVFNTLTNGGNYTFVLRHRNHLDIATATTITLPNTGMPYDLSNVANVMDGNNQVVDLGGGTYGLHAGDVDGNGIISVNDYNGYFDESTGSTTVGFYANDSDCDLDGNLTTNDFNTYNPNSSKIGVRVVRY